MKKKQLLQLPIPPLEGDPDITYPTERCRKYIYRGGWDESTGERVLIVDIFCHGTLKFAFRSCTNQAGQYCGWTKDRHISFAGMDYVLREFGWRTEFNPDNLETESAIRELTGHNERNGNALLDLSDYHENLKKAKLDRKHQKIKDRINALMEDIEEIRPEVTDWVENTLMRKSRYIFYVYNGKDRTQGLCTHCHSMVTVKRPHRNEKGICPACGSEITYLPEKQWNNTVGFVDEARFCLIQKVRAGFVVRYFLTEKGFLPEGRYRYGIYAGVDNLGDLKISEIQREFYDQEFHSITGNYFWGQFCNTGKNFWVTDNLGGGYETAICPIKLNDLIKPIRPELQYIDLEAVTNSCERMPISRLLGFKETKTVEYLVKLHLNRLAAEVINSPDDAGKVIDLEENNIKKALRIGKEDIAVLQRIDPDLRSMKLYQKLKKRDGKVDLEQFFWCQKNFDNLTNYYRIMSLIPFSQHQIIKYLMQQKGCARCLPEAMYKRSAVEKVSGLWIDYLTACRNLEYDLTSKFTVFPGDLIKAHDDAAAADQENKHFRTEKAIENMEEKLNQQLYFEDEKKGLLIRAPRSAEEIRQEGAKLHHCVGTYVGRMADGKTVILFVRKKENPEEPYYTVEIDPEFERIIQYRGFGNNLSPLHPVDPTVTAFLRRWKSKKMTA